MNTIVKLSVASALGLAAMTANADIAVPGTGSSDVILFAEVVNASGGVVASYAADTGVGVGAAYAGTNATYAGDANLAALFAADAAGDTLLWGVQGGQYTGNPTVGNFAIAGSAQFVSTANPTTGITTRNTANLIQWAPGLNNTIAALNTNFDTNGNGTSVEGPALVGFGIWDSASTNGVSGWYSNGPLAPMTALGTAESLYSITGGGSAGAHLPLVSNGTVTLTSAGLQFQVNGGTSPVPLPAAVWLLGSGLLGLAGVGRRKAAKVSAA